MSRLLLERWVDEERDPAPSVGAFDGRRLPLLAQLVHPLAPHKFVQAVYRQRVYATHSSARRFEPLVERLHRLSLARLLQDTPSEAIHVWVSGRLGGRPGEQSGGGRAESFKTEDAEAALACHRAGGSLYFRAPEEVSDLLVTALSQQLGMSYGALHPDGAARSEVETFASRAGHTTDWHFDFMENFTLQLSGSKRWRLKRGDVAHPVRGCTPMWRRKDAAMLGAAEQQAKCHAQHSGGAAAFEPEPAAEELEEGCEDVLLTPGSFLYLPAGTWHRVECEEDSLSVNVSLIGLCWADVLGDALKQRLRCHSAGRAPLCLHSLAQGRSQLADALALLAKEAAALRPVDLLPACMPPPRPLQLALPLASEADAEPAEPAEAGPPRRFRRNPLAVVLRAPTAEEAEESGGSEEGDGSDDDEDSDADSETRGESEGGGAGEEGAEGEAGERSGRAPSRLGRAIGRAELLTSGEALLVDGVDQAAVATWEGAGDPRAYVLHAQFGGEELASLLRVEVLAPPPLWPLLEWCRAAPATFSEEEARAAAGAGVGPATVAAALDALERLGFCNRLKQKRARAAGGGSSAARRARASGRVE